MAIAVETSTAYLPTLLDGTRQRSFGPWNRTNFVELFARRSTFSSSSQLPLRTWRRGSVPYSGRSKERSSSRDLTPRGRLRPEPVGHELRFANGFLHNWERPKFGYNEITGHRFAEVLAWRRVRQ